jgi:hypothetical protein
LAANERAERASHVERAVERKVDGGIGAGHLRSLSRFRHDREAREWGSGIPPAGTVDGTCDAQESSRA